MNYSIKTRIKSAALAAMMLLTSVPVSALTSVRAEAATITPTIKFTTNLQPNGNAEVITGRSVFIQEPTIQNLSSNRIVLQNSAGAMIAESVPSGQAGQTTNSAITISSPVDGVREIHFADTFDVKEGGKKNSDDAKNQPYADTYTITAVYQNITQEGEGYKIIGSDSTFIETIRSTEQLAIMTESRITIEANATETLSGVSFKVSDQKGAFLDIDSANILYSSGGQQGNPSLSENDNPKRTIAIALRDNTNSGSGQANTILTFDVSDRNENKNTGDDQEKTYNNFIQAGTKFQIIFRPITSAPIMLDVLTPYRAIVDLENQIKASDGVKDQSHVKMAAGDSLQYITQNFELRQKSDLHYGDFRIDWEWVPDTTTTPPAKNDTIQIGDTDGTDWRPVGIKREEDDLKGDLVATVTYIDTNNQEMRTISDKEEGKDERPRKVSITIRGTGKPINVTRYSYKIGDKEEGEPLNETLFEDDYKNSQSSGSPEPEPSPEPSPAPPESEGGEKVDEKLAAYLKLPQVIDMDAYQGGIGKDYIKNYPRDPSGPYEYTIQINLGAKNGTAINAYIDATGDVDDVTFQLKQGGNFQDYTPGTVIANPNYTNNRTMANIIYLKVIAKERIDKNLKRVNLTFSFDLPDANGTPQRSSQTFSTTLSINDNSPARDATLASLTFQDAETKEKIPFDVFSPDNFTYTDDAQGLVLHIPFKTRSFTITPTLNDRNAVDNTMSFQFLTSGGAPVEDNIYQGEKVPTGGGGEEEEEGGSAAGNDYILAHTKPSGEFRFYDESDTLGAGDKYAERYYDIVITVPCQDPRPIYWNKYTIRIIRDAPSDDDTLSSLGVYLEADSDLTNNLLEQMGQQFDPSTTEYDIWVPYSTQTLRVLASKNHAQAKLDEMVVLAGNFAGDESKSDIITDKNDKGQSINYTLTGTNLLDMNKIWLKEVKRHFDQLPPTAEGGVMTLRFTITSELGGVTPEEGDGQRSYYVHMHRLDPSTDSNVGSIIITDGDENERTYTPTFRPDTGVYTMNIPFSVRQLKFNINPNDPNVYKIELWEGATTTAAGGKKLAKYVNGTDYEDPNNNDKDLPTLAMGVLSKAFDVQDITSEYAQKHDGYHPFYIKVWAENSDYTSEYLFRVVREEPSHDSALINLQLKDGQNQEIKTFTFYWDQHGCEDPSNGIERGESYHVTVPYSTKQITFTPTTSHEYATVEIREAGLIGNVVGTFFPYTVESGATSKPFNLDNKAEVEKEFHVIVTAEDGKTQWVYCIKVSREPPSDDARLKSLVTQNTSNFKPLFISSKTEYTADVNEGAPGVIIIPTANHPGATIRVDGVVVQSGTPTDLIELLEVTQTVRIEVIAEDGVTRMVYRITFTNWNLIEKTSNADLRNLTVNYGLMTPNFQAAVLDYEVTTKENAWSVDIIPRLADPYATMRVLNGTLELGDYNGNYAMAIVDGLNQVSVEVTSPDKTVTKTYSVDIYRNDEEKLKNWKPLEAEDINFEMVGNPIIVKIEEYPRVGASVFNTIREEYPDRSIVFQGNDYSIRFDGENLTRVIPQTEIYDFQMSLTSPDEDAIYDLIAEYDYNDDIISDIVMLYFDYHGSLPGPATFSLSLGRHYGNDLLYWHYYNKERDRIDYYGSLQSNSQGNIAVSIDHFSTYIVSPEHRIAGSEDKDGVVDELGMVSNGQDLLGSGGKLNPNTGVPAVTAGAAGEAAEARTLPSFGQRPDLYIRKKETP